MILPLASGVIAPVAPGDRPAFWAVTGRLGGHSRGEFAHANLSHHIGDDPDAVARNLDELAGLVQIPGRELALMQPIHGNGIWLGNTFRIGHRRGLACHRRVRPGASSHGC